MPGNSSLQAAAQERQTRPSQKKRPPFWRASLCFGFSYCTTNCTVVECTTDPDVAFTLTAYVPAGVELDGGGEDGGGAVVPPVVGAGAAELELPPPQPVPIITAANVSTSVSVSK